MVNCDAPGVAPVKISLVIAMYNAVTDLAEFLESLRAQIRGRYELECVFVDDGSTDGTPQIVGEWIRTDGASRQIRSVLLRQHNQGPSAARNLGLTAATGEYVSFPDSDDYLSETYLFDVAEMILSHPEADLVDVKLVQWKEDEPRVDKGAILAFKYAWGDRVVALDSEPEFIKTHASSAFFRRNLIEASSIRFPTDLRASEDQVFCSMYLASLASPKIAVVSRPTYYYRRHRDAAQLSSQVWEHPEWTVAKVEHAYRAEIAAFKGPDGYVPRWFANVILYDYKWLLDSLAGQLCVAPWTPDLMTRLVEASRVVLAAIRPEDIDDFALIPLDSKARACMHMLADATWHTPTMTVGSVDAHGGSASFVYSCGLMASPVQAFTLDGQECPCRVAARPVVLGGERVGSSVEMELRLDGPVRFTSGEAVMPVAVRPAPVLVATPEALTRHLWLSPGPRPTPARAGRPAAPREALDVAVRAEIARERAERRLDKVERSRAYRLTSSARELAHGRVRRAVSSLRGKAPAAPAQADGLALFTGKPIVSPAIGNWDRPGSLRDTVVATIVDQFTAEAIAPECHTFPLHPATWQAELEDTPPDILFVESAWRGDKDSWHDTLYKLPNALTDIVASCRARGIPTVFWNKEDPAFFSRWLDTARLFDWVFTTAIECVPQYARSLEHDRVRVLPFGVQPLLHNPIAVGERAPASLFAGSHQAGFKQRMIDLYRLLDVAAEAGPVDIFDRHYFEDHGPYRWPMRYQQLVRGYLEPGALAVAYKQYSVGLNVNTVQNSETMFSRRILELMASNTTVISNYSRAEVSLFGDETWSTNDSASLLEGISQSLAKTPDDVWRRYVALHDVLENHGYRDRLEYVLSEVAGGAFVPTRPQVVFLGEADTQQQADALMSVCAAQQGVRSRLILVGDEIGGRREEVTVVARSGLGRAVRAVLGDAAGPVSVLSPTCGYGQTYARDLVNAFTFWDGDTVMKANAVLGEAAEYGPARVRARYRRSGAMTAWGAAAGVPLADLLRSEAVVSARSRPLVVDGFAYAPDEGTAIRSRLFDDPSRVSVSELGESAVVLARESLAGWGRVAVVPGAYPTGIRRGRKGAAVIVERLPSDEIQILSNQAAGAVTDIDLGVTGVENLPAFHGRMTTRFTCTDGALAGPVLAWEDESGQAVGSMEVATNREAPVTIPAKAQSVKVGLRVTGAGIGRISRLRFSSPVRSTIPQRLCGRVLLMVPGYPDYESPYRFMFVHSRVKEYARRGFGIDVFVYRWGTGWSFREYDGVPVIEGNYLEAAELLGSGRYRRLLVHFMQRPEWELVSHFQGTIPTTIWMHGNDAQLAHRRAFEAVSDDDATAMKADSDAKVAMWRDVFTQAAPTTGFVVPSRYFLDELLEDYAAEGIAFPAEKTVAIPNGTDTDLFSYEPKDASQRLRILSVRSYSAEKYATDLVQAAIVELSGRACFADLDFFVAGQGQNWERDTARLQGLPNVELRNALFSRQDLAAMQRAHGVLLGPTRWDSQGVSRDEAMSSGMVPVTSDCTGVPEFVSDEEGYLCPPEDPVALADAIEDMYLHPDVFLRKSEAAAARVRRQTAAAIVTPQELALFEDAFDPTWVTERQYCEPNGPDKG